VGLRPGLDRCGKSRPHRDSIPGPSSPLAVAIPTALTGPWISYVSATNTKTQNLRSHCLRLSAVWELDTVVSEETAASVLETNYKPSDGAHLKLSN
jgi:hypothetical protein